MRNKQGFHVQSGMGQRGWTPAGTKAGDYADTLDDQQFYASLAIHDPLWRYIIKNYSKEKEGQHHVPITPVTVLGYGATPIAVELSQWSYPVTQIVFNKTQFKRVKKDAQLQAGSMKVEIGDFRRWCPRGAVVCFVGILDDLPFERITSFLDMLLKQNREVIFAIKNGFRFKELFDKNYRYLAYDYPIGNYTFFSLIEKLEEELQ